MTLELNALSAGYGPVPVIENLTARAQPGQLIALVGPNGAGKSTLIKSLAGVNAMISGSATLFGDDLKRLGRIARARRVSYLSQSRDIVWPISGRALVALGRAPYRGALGQMSAQDEAQIERAITLTSSQALAARDVTRLSGGEQARLLLARALAVDAQLILADEPFAALDPYYQIALMTVLKAEAGRGKIVICALHDLAMASHFADQIWVLHRGALISAASPKTALSPALLQDVFGISPPKGGFQIAQIAPPQS